MTYLSEDPTILAGGLALLAGVCFIAMRVTQQGKYLAWALGALGLAGVVLLIDVLWVTDNERIERVVYGLRRAVLAADADQVLENLTPDVEYVQSEMSLSGEATRALIRGNLANASFDFVHLRDLQISSGRQTRRGKAEFRIYAKGTLRTSMATYTMGTANSTWSLGFQETAPGVWKVNRITPVSVPESTIQIPAGSLPSRRMPGPGKGSRSNGDPHPPGSSFAPAPRRRFGGTQTPNNDRTVITGPAAAP